MNEMKALGLNQHVGRQLLISYGLKKKLLLFVFDFPVLELIQMHLQIAFT